ncbi:hypothetical protein CDL15_Pgr003508 [Punica granatum]|uniref:Uncharacterized protein n=1 Tax=Punica granatum TaxID=22663 RepID=A0A218X2A7_PUNGR|nr:hypothetical protein CDL15_Pgr003508 [Punica granatum]
MSLSLKLTLSSPATPQTHHQAQRINNLPRLDSFRSISRRPSRSNLAPVARSVGEGFDRLPAAEAKDRWESWLSTAASLYPVYVTVGGVVACLKPSTFSWFVERGPTSYSLSLGLIMLSMGLTLELKDLFALFMQRPLSVSSSAQSFADLNSWLLVADGSVNQILFGCAAQYTIMPLLGTAISRLLGLPPLLSVGLILLACCPGGTASNVVTLIARGDVPLSIIMTVCTTFGAVLLTPLLTKILAGTYVPVDAFKLSMSTLQVVVAPILLGSYLQSTFPRAVEAVIPFAPLFAVLLSSLLACSYMSSAICRFKEPQRRAISIEVGMQNSSLGVVLATSHFTSPLVTLPAAVSAVIMNIMGSSLGFFWRYIDPSDPNKNTLEPDKTRP